MASRLQNLKGMFTDVKTRTIIIFTGALLAIGVMVGVFGIAQKSKTLPAGASETTAVPSVSSVPGLSPPPSVGYANALAETNQRTAEAAKETGGSAVPTLISPFNQTAPPQALLNPQHAEQLNLLKPQINLPPALPATAPRIQSQQPGTPGAAVPQQVAAQQPTAQHSGMTLKNPYGGQMGDLLSAWSRTPTQEYVRVGDQPGLPGGATGMANPAGGGMSPGTNPNMAPTQQLQGPPTLLAGDIIFAVLETAVNTDEPGPVLATIVAGKLNGAKLLGTMKRVEKRVEIVFSRVRTPNATQTDAINAYAIDPETARIALATGVDSHYLLRYGSLFAAAFMQGYANAITQGGTSVNIVPGGIAVTTPVLTPHQQVIAGFGQVGQQLGAQMGQYFNTPPTVTVASGTSIGVLLMDDLRVR